MPRGAIQARGRAELRASGRILGPMSSAPTRTRRRLRARHKIALALGAFVVGLLALEGAVRVRHWLKTGSFGPIYEFAVDEASGLQIPLPGPHGRIVCDSRGFRSPEITSLKPEGTVRVAFLGGSTTFCAETSGNDATWPARVVAALRDARPGKPFDWVNASAAGYSVEQSLRNLTHRVAPLEPDVIVIYHGTNDLTKDTRALAAEKGLWQPDAGASDWLEEHSMLWELVKKNLLIRGRGEGPRAEGTLEIDAEALAAGFETRLTELVRACQEVAPVVAVVTFSHRVRPEQTPQERRAACQSALYYMPFLTPDSILEGVTAYNAAIRRVAAATGAVLVAGADRIPADAEHFNDSVHLLDAGCRIQAERVTEALLASEAFGRLVR